MKAFEEYLGSIFGLLEPAKGANGQEYKVYFNWGSEKVLNKYLSVQDNKARYPLIWLVNDSDEEDISANRITRQARLILAMHSDKQDYFNPDIYGTDYKLVLNPLKDNIIKALERSGISYISQKNKVKREPNYSVTQSKDKNATLDVWNALILDVEITIKTDRCLVKTIKF